MASDPITSWQTEQQRVEEVTDFILGSKITVDGDCNHEIRRRLLPCKESYNKPRQCVRKPETSFC